MPVYEYECPKCKIIIDVFDKINNKNHIIKCRKCKVSMKKIISKNNFYLKGSGWAKDGYNSKK